MCIIKIICKIGAICSFAYDGLLDRYLCEHKYLWILLILGSCI